MLQDVTIGEVLTSVHELTEFLQEHMITREELTEELTRFATKEDLVRFATKEDLARFATKEDLIRFATKQDLERFATKEDLVDMRLEMRFEMKSVLQDFQTQVQESIYQMKSELATDIDQFVQLHTKLDHEIVAVRSRCDRIEGRIDVVERHSGISPMKN